MFNSFTAMDVFEVFRPCYLTLNLSCQGRRQDFCVAAGMQAARMSCAVSAAIPTSLSSSQINWEQKIESRIIL